MALLMNSVNVVFRRVVKNWDDGITTPVVTRAYYYLMQFSDKEEIKGDYAVKARGSSVLLVREVAAQNLLMLATQATQHPVLGSYYRVRNLLKKLHASMLIDSDDVLKTEAELEEDAARQAEAEQNAPPDPALVALELQQQLAQMEGEVKLQLAQIKAEGDMQKAALAAQAGLEEMHGRLEGIRMQMGSKERLTAAEIGVETRRDQMGITRGSGGVV